jgi:ABC-type multidrug transport system fused ATPase/permease subunit
MEQMSVDSLRNGMNVVLQNPYINENESVRRNLLGIKADSQAEDARYSDENLYLILK